MVNYRRTDIPNMQSADAHELDRMILFRSGRVYYRADGETRSVDWTCNTENEMERVAKLMRHFATHNLICPDPNHLIREAYVVCPEAYVTSYDASEIVPIDPVNMEKLPVPESVEEKIQTLLQYRDDDFEQPYYKPFHFTYAIHQLKFDRYGNGRRDITIWFNAPGTLRSITVTSHLFDFGLKRVRNTFRCRVYDVSELHKALVKWLKETYNFDGPVTMTEIW